MRIQVPRIEFSVEGEPRPQPRPTASGKGKFIRMIATPAQSPCAPFKENLNLAARSHMAEIGAQARLGPVFIEIDCVWPRTGKLKNVPADQRVWRFVQKRDDWDNLGKSVCDAINGVVYVDDSQIVGATVRKFYGRVGEAAHVRIVLRSLLVREAVSGG
jgi:Holliday junction resolvase RusA-like endonuclease